MAAAEKQVAAALAAVKEEGRKTEVAAEKRFELLNELRGDVATKDQVEALEKVVDELKKILNISSGKGQGINMIWVIFLGAIGVIGTSISIFNALK